MSTALVILDEGCEVIESRIASVAEVQRFSRSAGIRSSPAEAAAELHSFVGRFPLERIVFVTASFGAFTGLLYCDRYRDRISDLLLLDPSHPDQCSQALRIMDAHGAGASSGGMADFREMMKGFGPAWDEGCRLVRQISTIGSTRLRILEAGKPECPGDMEAGLYQELVDDRHACLLQYLSFSSNSSLCTLPDAGHWLLSHAEDIVVNEVLGLARE